MKMIIIPREEYQVSSSGIEAHTSTYFGNVLATSAEAEQLPEYQEDVDYKYLDEVQIVSLNTKYTAVVDAPKGHPQSSPDWFQEGTNPFKFRDNIFTSKTIFKTTATIDFKTLTMTHLVGQNIDNVKRIEIRSIRENGSSGEIIETIEMIKIDGYDCDSCCNPEPYMSKSFFYAIGSSCEIDKIRVEMIPYDSSKPVAVGSMAVGSARDLGRAKRGMNLTIKIPKNVTEFRAIRQTGVRPANIETYIQGETYVNSSRIDELRQIILNHGAFLNFYIFDDKDEVKTGIVLGRFLSMSSHITGASTVLMPIEIFGIQN